MKIFFTSNPNETENNSIALFSKIFPVALLALLSSWPIFLYLCQGYTIYSNSQLNFTLPLRYHAVKTILNGNLPLWNPNIFCGMSLIGDAVSLPFDPFGLLLVFFSPLLSFVVLPAVQLFLAGIFMYFYLLKGLKLSKYAALLGGSLSVFSPLLILGIGVQLDNHIPFQGILLFPLVAYFVEKSIHSNSSKMALNSIFAGLCLALVYFSTTPNIVCFVGVFIFFYLFFYKISFYKKIKILFIVCTVTFLLTAIQLLPTMEVVKSSHRTLLWQPGLHDYKSYSYQSLLRGLYLGVYKIFEAGGVDRPFFLGIFNSLLLLLAYRFKTNHNSINAYKILFIFFLLTVLGFFRLPLKGLIISVFPFLKGAHISHMAFLIYFCAFILIAYSFNTLLSNPEKKGRYITLAFTFVFILVSAILFIRYHLHEDVYRIFRDSIAGGKLPSFHVVSYTLFFLVSFVLFIALLFVKKYKKIIAGCLCFCMIGHLFVFWHKTFIATVGSKQMANMSKKTIETTFLKNMSPLDRMEIYYGYNYWKWNQENLEQGLTMHLPLFFGANIAGGQLSLHSYRDRILFDAINGRYPFDKEYYWKDGKYVQDSGRAYLEKANLQKYQRFLNLLGIKYIFSAEKLIDTSLKLIAKGSSYYIYENLDVFLRSFIVYEQEILKNDNEILDALVGNRVDLSKTVLCQEEILTKSINEERFILPTSHVEFKKFSPNYISLNVQSSHEGILVLMDSYDKGWRVYVDGQSEVIHRVNYKFRGVRIPPGEHTVIFRYLPKSFLAGAIISSLSLLLIVGIIIFLRNKDKAEQNSGAFVA